MKQNGRNKKEKKETAEVYNSKKCEIGNKKTSKLN